MTTFLTNHPLAWVARWLWVGALVLALGACKVSQDVGLPDMQLPATYRSASGTDTVSVATLPWKSFFTENNLKQLLDSALVRNNDLQLAVTNIASAQATLRQARAGYAPTIGLQTTATLNRPSTNSLNGISFSQFLGTRYIEDYLLGANVAWEADIWGKIRSRKAEALAAYLQTQEARNAVQTQLVAQVSDGYYNLLMLDAQLTVARRNLQLNDSTLRLVRLQFTAGQITSLAVQQIEAQRLTAAGLVPQFEQEITVQENALRTLTGRLPGPVERGGSLLRQTVPAITAAGVPAALLSRRPDVRSAERALDRANAVVGYTKAQLYPTLAITAQSGLNAFKASNWFSVPASLFGIVGGGLTQPVFQRRALRTQYEQAQIDRERTVIQFRQQVLVGVEEVSNALVRVTKLQAQGDTAAVRVQTLQKATKDATLLFRNGMATYLEVLAAQSNALQSELELVAIKRAQLSANVELYRAVGGGWQ